MLKYPPLLHIEEAQYRSLVGSLTFDVLMEIERLDRSWQQQPPKGSPLLGRDNDNEPYRGWSIPRSSGVLLHTIARVKQPRVVLEIGTSFGYSGIWLGSALAGHQGELYSCELHEEKALLAKNFITRCKLANVKILTADAVDVARTWSRSSIEMMFLDADPIAYPFLLNALQPNLAPNAMIIIDNCLDRPHATGEFVSYLRSRSDYETWLHPVDHGFCFAIWRGAAVS